MANPTRTFDSFPVNVVITPNSTAGYMDINSFNPTQQHGIAGSKYVAVARVVASYGVLYVAVDSSTGPVLFFKENFTEQLTDSNGITRFTTVSGKIIAVKKDKGCGCGSRLKNWSPVGTISQSSRG
jgi:hypothetical protein